MKVLKTFLILVIAYFNTSLCGELVLQNGLNGYNGCLDSHIRGLAANQDISYEKLDTLLLQWYTGG